MSKHLEWSSIKKSGKKEIINFNTSGVTTQQDENAFSLLHKPVVVKKCILPLASDFYVNSEDMQTNYLGLKNIRLKCFFDGSFNFKRYFVSFEGSQYLSFSSLQQKPVIKW